ncbi:type II/IV secretion system protein [bacterium]|nr:type II/IV secretion system protein [bacterium]MBT4649320.1 type II/IV secretion system protein [bacterium]
MTKKELKKILDFLLSKKSITDDQYQEFAKQTFANFSIAEKQIRRKILVSDEDWTQIKALFFEMEYGVLSGKVINAEILNILPQDLAENYRMVVFDKKAKNIHAGIVNPTNLKAMDALNFLARKHKYNVKFYIISEDSYRSALKQYETLGEEVGAALDTAEAIFAPKDQILDDDDGKGFTEVIKSAPVSKIVSVILRHAIEGRASDIHIEPVGNQSKIRYRIDGVLHTTIVLPIYVHSALISRIKVMSNLKIDETRIPQDGRIRIKIHGKDVDFRISTIPLMGHEKVVMRILETPDKAPTFEELGFMGNHAKRVAASIKKPNGLFLVTGPTGSGKSTTLFAGLSVLNREDVNIATLEDPVEYYVPGVNQSQVRPEVGFTFATGLRALLRQDPDIIMVGEIRDNETAELSIHAGLTGHFVLSTLHTNDALGAIPRMFDMHIEPFLLASTLNVVIAQRLVRKICTKCKEEITLPDNILEIVKKKLVGIPDDAFYGGASKDKLVFYKGKGCAQCGDTGYKGRVAIVETIDINKKMKDIVAKGFDRTAVDEELAKQAFITMDLDGLIKSLLGLTTVEEILRVSAM